MAIPSVILYIVVPVTLVSWSLGNDPVWIAAIASIFALIATAAVCVAPLAKATRMTVSVTLIAEVSVLVAACEGSAWQVDIHMYYFGMMAILAAYCDRDAIMCAGITIILQHVVLNYFASMLVSGW